MKTAFLSFHGRRQPHFPGILLANGPTPKRVCRQTESKYLPLGTWPTIHVHEVNLLVSFSLCKVLLLNFPQAGHLDLTRQTTGETAIHDPIRGRP